MLVRPDRSRLTEPDSVPQVPLGSNTRYGQDVRHLSVRERPIRRPSLSHDTKGGVIHVVQLKATGGMGDTFLKSAMHATSGSPRLLGNSHSSRVCQDGRAHPRHQWP